ncbi:Peptidase C2 domain containing protein, partial [Asbolus verrucosus]
HSTNYQAIRRACRERGSLFEDPDFPAGPRALYHHKKPALHPIVWMRPHEMCQRPRFVSDSSGETQRFAVEAGDLGDQWLLAAVASLALTPRFLDRIVPPDQGFDNSHSYCGVF